MSGLALSPGPPIFSMLHAEKSITLKIWEGLDKAKSGYQSMDKGNRIMCDFEMEQGEHFVSNVRASLRIFVGGGGQTPKLPSQGGGRL